MATDVFPSPLLSLPPELHLKILTNLPIQDLCRARQVCHLIHQASDRDQVWAARARQDFGVGLRAGPGRPPPRVVYQKLLHRYGDLCGLWQRQNLKFYSGLLKVQWDPDIYCLVMDNLLPTPDIAAPLVRRRFLTIGLKENSEGAWEVQVTNMDRMTSTQEVRVVRGGPFLEVINSNMRDYITSPTEWRELLAEFRSVDPEADTELALMKFVSLYHSRSHFSFLPLFSSDWLDKHDFVLEGTPIRPGLFKGTYGGHGVELVHLQVFGATMEGARGVKVTGDPNVPFNEVTFSLVDGANCLDLSLEDQATLEGVQEFMADPRLVPYQEGLSMDFVVPAGMRERANVGWKSCKGRWAAEAQIASHMFQNPQFISAHFVLFSQDEFAVLFLELNSLSMFHRETLLN